MNSDNVTPIVQAPPRATKRARQRPGLVLAESDEHEGFTTLDVLAGLDGVCGALVDLGRNTDLNIANDLSIAAKVLVSILRDRIS